MRAPVRLVPEKRRSGVDTLSLVVLAAVMSTGAAWAADVQHFEAEVNADHNDFGQTSMDSSLTFAPFGGIDDSGFRLRTTLADSDYFTFADVVHTTRNRGNDAQATLLAGYTFAAENWSLFIGAGPDLVRSYAWSGTAPVSATNRIGAQAYASLYANPTDQTMLLLQGHYTTATGSGFLQAKTGYALLKGVFVGPEASFSRGTNYEQSRLGAFIAGIPLGPIQIGFSAGAVFDRTEGRGVYGGVSMRTTF